MAIDIRMREADRPFHAGVIADIQAYDGDLAVVAFDAAGQSIYDHMAALIINALVDFAGNIDLFSIYSESSDSSCPTDTRTIGAAFGSGFNLQRFERDRRDDIVGGDHAGGELFNGNFGEGLVALAGSGGARQVNEEEVVDVSPINLGF